MKKDMNRGSLLLVDDDRQVLGSMADWLREQGYAVETAADRGQAIAQVENSRAAPFDLVLADIIGTKNRKRF